MKNLMSGLIAIAILTFFGLACSQSDSKTDNATNKTTNSSDNKSNSNDSKSTSNDNKTTASTSDNTTTARPVRTFDGDIDGDYSVTGKVQDGRPYDGSLKITKQGEVYEFSWNAGNSVYDGVGVRDGNLVAVGYGAGTQGKGCGAAIYRIGNKTLEGSLGGWGYNNVGKQSALLTKDSAEGSLYTVSGNDTDGSDYSGNLYVAKSKSDVYHFAYSGGKVKYIGTGIKVGDYFGAGLGIKKCGYVVYDISKGNTLEAAWGIVGDDRLGTEIATRK